MEDHNKKLKPYASSYFSLSLMDKYLNTDFIGKISKYVDEVDSTNLAAKQEPFFPSGSLLVANSQTDGKGRLGREWVSECGTGIYASLVLTPFLPLRKIPQITLIAGMAVCRALGNNARIKWPNDIVIGSKKVCGILTEAFTANDGANSIVCGIGINVNDWDFPEEIADKATSLLIETKKKYSREKILANVLNELEPLYTEFLEKGFSPLLDEYRSLCATLNSEVRAIYQNKMITGTAIDIDDVGRLIVKTEDDIITINAGEVSVRGMLGYV